MFIIQDKDERISNSYKSKQYVLCQVHIPIYQPIPLGQDMTQGQF